MKKCLILIVGLLFILSAAKAQQISAATYLVDFETFVSSVEKNDSVIDWNKTDSIFDKFREVYRAKYKEEMTDGQLSDYNSLKARYTKQVALKKVGKDIANKAKKVKSKVLGTLKGTFKKKNKKE